MIALVIQSVALAPVQLSWLRAALARRRRSDYASDVPEKEGNGFGSLNTQSAQTAQRGFFTCVCFRMSPMSGGGGEALGLAGLFGCQSSNPVTCRPPRLEAGRGVTATQGGPHA